MKRRQKGFTLVEMLVVVAVLGVLAAVVVPNVGKFIGRGKVEAQETELHNIMTATMAMLADSETAQLVPVLVATNDMDTVVTTDTTTTPAPLVLTGYIAGLNADGTVRTGCTYTFTADGEVGQVLPP